MKVRSATLLIALGILTQLIGCTGRHERPVNRARAIAPSDGGTLVRRLEADVHTLNYVLQTTDFERHVLAYLFDPLIDLDQNLRPVPGLAAKWDIQQGGKVYILHLDPRATFSDGARVKASDVVFTLNKIVSENSEQFATWFEGIDLSNTKAIDESTVQVAFSAPRVAQVFAFNVSVLPEHVYGKGKFADDFNETVLGNGAYKLVKREPGRSIRLERREDYWREKPAIKSVLFRVIGDDTVAWQALKKGDIDETRVKPDVWAFEKDRAAVQSKVAFHDFFLLSYNCIPWNLRDPLFKDASVRRALAMAFDRNAVIEHVYRGQARPVTGPFTPDQWANDPGVAPVAFDPAGATALLASAGWRDSDGDKILDKQGRKMAFEMLVPAGNASTAQQSQILQESLRRIGVDMRITTLDGAAFFGRLMKGDFQSAFMAWSSDPDPGDHPYVLFHSSQRAPQGMNIIGYDNPEIDRLLEQGRSEFDQARRTAIYHQVHRILARDQPYLWTVQVATKWAVNRRVEGVSSSKGFGLFSWYPGQFAWRLRSAEASTQ